MSNDDQLQALERLAKLRDGGALSADEFAAKKAAILNEAATVHAPFYRRLWFVVLLTCLILTFPIALIILLTGEVYKKVRGTRKPISNKARYIYASILGLCSLRPSSKPLSTQVN
jgi:Short C-terminal domain